MPGCSVNSATTPAATPTARARRNYAATSPITHASRTKKVVAARFVHNNRLVDALNAQAFPALTTSPGARAFHDELRAHGLEHNDALRRLANRLAGILHGCLKTRTLYDEATAWDTRKPPSIVRSRLTLKLLGCLSRLEELAVAASSASYLP
jgi:hypothetical protein